MQIRKPRSWELPDSVVTPEADYLRRRDFLRVVGLGVAATAIFPATIRAATAGFPDALDPAFKLDGVKLTPYNLITSYNNFYEWGPSKEDPQQLANRGWKTEPWTVEIGGLCAKPAQFDVNDLIKTIGGIEQRNYRHRCVEAWSMVIPWDGFPLAKLIAMAEPMAEAKFVKFTSFYDPAVCPGQTFQ
jgi:methionine sulfoxide reductase catalytic subunit